MEDGFHSLLSIKLTQTCEDFERTKAKEGFKMKRWLIGILMLGMVIGIAGSSWGDPPRLINIQGRLTGDPVPSRVTFTITEVGIVATPPRVYEREVITSGTPVAGQILIDSNGVFNVILGRDDDGRDLYEFLEESYFLRISIDGVDLSPVQQLIPVPFAITSRNVRGGTVVAQSATSHGVRGESSGTGLSSGVTGANLSTEPNAGIGVSGLSSTFGIAGAGGRIGVTGFGGVESLGVPTVTGVGVYGSGVSAGGYFVSESGYGVRATGGSGFASIYAEKDEDTAGNGIDVRLLPPFGSSYGVFSYTAGNGEALHAQSAKGYGVWARGSTTRGGIVGTTRDGAETNPTAIASDFGIYGQGNYGAIGVGENIGVYASGNNYGVSANSSGTAVVATSSSDTDAGVRAINTGDGPALDLTSGWITMPGITLSMAVSDLVRLQNITGRIINDTGADGIMNVYNNRWDNAYTNIIITPLNAEGVGTYVEPDPRPAFNDSFRIHIRRGGRVAFLVIN
jgi:hypothetical protein